MRPALLSFALLSVALLALGACREAPPASGDASLASGDAPAPTAATGSPPEAAGHGGAPPAGPVTYTCADGGTFTVAPQPGGAAAEVALPGRTLMLERTDASMGARYGEGDVEVWITDDGAFVAEQGEMTLKDCREASGA